MDETESVAVTKVTSTLQQL